MSVYQETSLNLSEKTYPVMNPILIPRGQVTADTHSKRTSHREALRISGISLETLGR